MASYRIYRLDGAGRISAAEWVEAEDDAAATERAAALVDGRGVIEIWARKRLVARVETTAEDQPPESSAPIR